MRPLALVFGGREHPLGGMWQNMPIVLCHLLDALHPNLLKGFANAGVIPHLSLDGADLRRGQEIADLGVWFEKNLSARDFIGQARKMLEAFRVDPAQAAVKMEPRDATARVHAKPCEWPAAENAPAPGNAIVPPSGGAGRPALPDGVPSASSAAFSPASPASSSAHSPAISPAPSAAALAPTSSASSPSGSAAGFCRARAVAPTTASTPVPASGDRIGAYAKREIYAALVEGRVPDDDFARLLTLEGTREIVGVLPHGCPVFALELAPAGRERWHFWKDCAYRGGVPVFVNSQWMKDRHEAYLERLLARWRGAAGGEAGRPALSEGVPSASPAASSSASSSSAAFSPAFSSAFSPASAPNPSPASSSAGSAAGFARTRVCASAPSPLTDAQRANLAELLEAEFSNGFRLSGYIHEKKIRELHSRRFGEELPENLDLGQAMPQVGVLIDGKVFPRPSSNDGGWRRIVDGLVEEGHKVFQFSRLMARHADDFMRLGVGSSKLLHAAVVREAADVYEMKGEFLLRKGVGDVADAVLKRLVAGDSAIVEIKATGRRLPYVEESYVNELLRKDGRFVWNAKDEYAILGRIEFDDAEVQRGRALCESCISEDGFFSLEQLLLEDSAAMNDSRLSDSALRNAFYFRFLDGRFTRHGRIVHEVGVDVPATAPLLALCRNRNDDISYDEIDAIAKEYKIDIRTALDAVCAERVRVSQGRFVKAEWVEFDVDAVDAAISLHMAGAPTAFGAFGDFRDFPAVPGYEWNGFLLEAYLSYSRRYRFFALSPSVNEVAGVVAERKAGFADAFDAFAAAAIAAGVPSDQEAVGDFLVRSRCALRRGKTMLESVVAAMRKRETRAK